MRALFVTTETNDMERYVESFTCLGNEVRQHVFEHVNTSKVPIKEIEKKIMADATAYKPEMIVYIGACKSHTPTPYFFKKLRDIAPTVHLCPDAADEPWWPELIEFDRVGAFDVQVAMDGNKEWPLADTQITTLMAFNPGRYKNKPHKDRTIQLGFAGDPGGMRRSTLRAITNLEIRERTDSPYQQVADFLSDCRMVVNVPETGSYKRMHVKWRVMETGLAGAALLEKRDSPTNNWFTKGTDYLEWESVEELLSITKCLSMDDTQRIGENLRSKLLKKHSPEKFWNRIINTVGLSK